MNGIKVKNDSLGIEDTLRDWNSQKRILKLKSGIVAIDLARQWLYYNHYEQRWCKCFSKKETNNGRSG